MTKRKDKKYRGTQCLNCHTALDISEKYCHHCGQLNSTKKITIKDFFEEFLSNFYAYDSRLRNSILSIFTKPGVLAKEYNEGKRQKYANPFRLFLSVSLILFLSLSVGNSNNLVKINPTSENNLLTTKDIENANKEIENAKLPDSIASKFLKSTLSKIQKDTVVHSVDSIYTKEYIAKHISRGTNPLKYTITSFRNYHLKFPDTTDTRALHNLGYENNRINRFMFNKAKFFKTNNIYEEIRDYFYKKLPFLLFLSLPIITIIFWIVFYSRKINYTEHLVFSYTFFTFMFLCMIVFNLIHYFNNDIANIITSISYIFLFPLYLYKSLRNFYQQSRWITIIKFVILNPLFGLFFVASALLMIFIGLILF